MVREQTVIPLTQNLTERFGQVLEGQLRPTPTGLPMFCFTNIAYSFNPRGELSRPEMTLDVIMSLRRPKEQGVDRRSELCPQ